MISLSREEASAALGLEDFPLPIEQVSTDTRTMMKGDAFVALRGQRFDGHAFVETALERGASAILVDGRWWDSPEATAFHGNPDPRLVVVPDTGVALGILARTVRRKSQARVIAVTGSAGKTSTKDLIAAMARRAGRKVASTSANQNNEVGVPLTLLSLTPDTEVAVVEMGMRGQGQIAVLARWAEADVGVITNIHPVHLELLGSVEAIAEAKAELIVGLEPSSVGVIPADCPLLTPHLAGVSARILRFSLHEGRTEAEVWARVLGRRVGGGVLLRVHWPEGEAEVEVPFLSRHRLENTVAALAACYGAGLPPADCLLGLNDVEFTSGRGDVMEVGSWVIVDDTYNANPAAVRAAVDDLVDLAAERRGRPVAVLGDMLELGPDAERLHTECGAYAAEAGVQVLWGVGRLSRATVEGFSLAGEGGQTAIHVETVDEADRVLAGLQPGDVVLFKASRSVRLETMVSALMKVAAPQSGPAAPTVEGDRA